MCGILGHIKLEGEIDEQLFAEMLHTLAHRGPDGEGVFISENRQIALGHKRLSFIDLSDSGKQPFISTNEQIIVSFNGEIYNYLELKDELSKEYNFITNSDTEVIIAAYIAWGISFIDRLKGMFAIALIDRSIKQLFLIRDRFGIKPLYYGFTSNQLVFASELKAILKAKVFEKEINKSALADYFVYRYIPSPKTIWNSLYKVAPANYLKIDLVTFKTEVNEYWKLSGDDKKPSIGQLTETTKQLLLTSVKLHVRADVPIGSFLSGGYDSSALVLWMTELGLKPYTFSIGFDQWNKSEDQFAKIVADHLAVPNDSTIANTDSLMLVDKMAEVYDEPIADISIVPTYLVSELARRRVKAVVSGEGADELFGGYTWQHDYFNQKYTVGFIQQLKNLLRPSDPVQFYAQSLAMGWFDDKELKNLLHPDYHAAIPEDVHWFYRANYKPDLSPMKAIQHMDIKCFMGELVLTKIDRASMANSLEVRVPFLDHHLFETIFSTDEEIYLSKNQTKKILFNSIKEGLPKEILDRKKQGFVGPDSYYMDIEYYKRELLNSNLVKYNVINKSYLDTLLKESYNWKLWKILIMEKWFSYWMVA